MRRRASVTLEFALVAPVLIAGTFGVLDWSWYLFQSFAVTTAAHRGARMAAGVSTAHVPASAASHAAQAWLLGEGVDTTGLVVTVTVPTRSYGSIVDVQVDVPFESITGLIPTPSRLHGHATSAWYGDAGN